MTYEEALEDYKKNGKKSPILTENKIRYDIFLAVNYYTNGIAYLGTTHDFIDYPTLEVFNTQKTNGYKEITNEITASTLPQVTKEKLTTLLNTFPIYDYVDKPVADMAGFVKVINDRNLRKSNERTGNAVSRIQE